MMNDPSKIRMDGIAATMADTETMWLTVCNNVDAERVEMLIQAMVEQHALVIEG